MTAPPLLGHSVTVTFHAGGAGPWCAKAAVILDGVPA